MSARTLRLLVPSLTLCRQRDEHGHVLPPFILPSAFAFPSCRALRLRIPLCGAQGGIQIVVVPLDHCHLSCRRTKSPAREPASRSSMCVQLGCLQCAQNFVP